MVQRFPFPGLNRETEAGRRACRSGHVGDSVHRAINLQESVDVLRDEAEGRITLELFDVLSPSRQEIVHAQNFMPQQKQLRAKMSAQETGHSRC